MDDPDATSRTPPPSIDVGLASAGLPATGDWPEDIPAEVQVEQGQVQVTIPLPFLDQPDLRYFVGSNLLLVWSHRDPDNVRTMVRLPVDVVTDTAVMRFTNGVFDLTVLVADSPQDRSPPEGTQ